VFDVRSTSRSRFLKRLSVHRLTGIAVKNKTI
jgi:hypothetical protein